MRRHHILLLVVALIAVLPLFVFGCSCGHDFDFHIQSWLEAKRQLLHGTFRPHWVFSAAYNAGEPRFVFYPPLSWVLGELLALFVPVKHLPAVYTFIALLIAGQTMYFLAKQFVDEDAAAIGAALYIVNPYMLFTAYERTAFAELLAAAWMPLLLAAVWRKRPTIAGIAVPLALLWLTNAPAAVIGSYAMAVIMAVRLAIAWRANSRPEARQHLLVATGGAVLGLALTAFYLLPAAYERRFVQIAMAVIVNMRVQDNFLFGHTGDLDHDGVLHTASWIAVTLLGATFAFLVLRFSRRNHIDQPSTPKVVSAIVLLTAAIAFMLTPLSQWIWQHIPQLAFLQFPWRLLTVSTVALGLSAALLATSFRLRFYMTAAIALAIALSLTALGSHEFRQACEASDDPTAIAAALQNHQGFPATDEYTPVGADNDALSTKAEPYWYEGPRMNSIIDGKPARLGSATLNGLTETTLGKVPSQANPDGWIERVKDVSNNPRIEGFIQESTAFEEDVAGSPDTMVLNLRAYPNWEVHVVSDKFGSYAPLKIQHRADGLIAFAVRNPDHFTVSVRWRRSLDEQIGIAISILSAVVLSTLLWHSCSRKINT